MKLFLSDPHIFNSETLNAFSTAITSVNTEEHLLSAGHLVSAILKQRETPLYKVLNELVPDLEKEIIDLDRQTLTTQKTAHNVEIQTTHAFNEAINLAAIYAQHKNQTLITLPDLFYALISSEFLTPAVMFADTNRITPRKLEKYL